MTSKADRKRRKAAAATRPRVGRGSQNAGRPRQEGDRYPSGDLKPPGPNPVVIAMRQQLLGPDKFDLSKAENALDLALERGWMTQQHHQTARAFAALHRRAFKALSPPKTPSGDPDKTAKGFDGSGIDERAMTRLRGLWGRLTLEQQRILYEDAVLDSWPQWVIYRSMVKPVPPAWEHRRIALFAALDVVLAVLDGHNGYGSLGNETVAS